MPSLAGACVDGLRIVDYRRDVTGRHVSRAYYLFVALSLAQFTAFMAVGQTQVKAAGVLLFALALLWLGRGSRTAWWLFVVANAGLLLFTLVLFSASESSAGGIVWGNLIAVVVGCPALLATLLSSGMRRHVVRRATAA